MDLRIKLNDLKVIEDYARFRQPQLAKCIIVRAWERINQLRPLIGPPRKFEIFDYPYDALTEKIKINTIVGMRRKSEKGFSDTKMILTDDTKMVITELYDLERDSIIVYTDGSRGEHSRSTGAIVFENNDYGYKVSLNGLCSSYTAEAFAIKAALEIIVNRDFDRCTDMIVFSDCKSVLETIKNNHLNVYKNVILRKSETCNTDSRGCII